MDKRNFISVSLLVSALAFNPLVANDLNTNTTSQRQINSVTASIAHILHKRGLDEDVAKEISKNLIDDEDEFFAAMIDNLVNEYRSLTKDEVFEHLSTVALHRQNIQLDSYEHLIGMVSKIKGKPLNEQSLKQLNRVAKLNKEMHIA